MKNIFLTLFAATALMSCNTKVESRTTTSEVDKDKIKSEIEAMETAYSTAFNARNIDGVLVYYAEDAETYETGTPPLIGKAAIKAELEKDFKQIPNGMNIAFKTKDLRISNDGAQVVETGEYSVKDSSGTAVGSGNFLALFEKKDGKYLCVRDMITSNEEEK